MIQPCPRCGALNGSEFDSCIRCGAPVGDAASTPPRADGRSGPPPSRAPDAWARSRPSSAPGRGAEPLLGRWEATDLPAAKGLLALTLLVFAAQTLVALDGRVSLDRVLLQGGHVVEPFRFGAMPSGATDMLAEEPWRLLSACFVHFGIVHVFLNMLTFVHLARLAEPAVGSVRFFIVYVASGIISFATTVLWSVLAPQHGITAGASGSIFGLMGFVLGFLIRRRDPRWKLWLGQAVFISLLFSFAMTNVNNSAHIGGLCAGVAFGYAFAPGAPKPSTGWQRVTAAVGVLGCLGALLAAQLSPYWRLLARAVAAQAS